MYQNNPQQFILITQQQQYNQQQKKPHKQKMQQSPQKSSITNPNHTHKLGNKQFALYIKSQPRLSTLIYNIQKYLSNYQPFYYNALLSFMKGRDLDILQKQLELQYQRIKNGKCFLQKINNAMFSRNKCLDKIKRQLTKVQTVLTMFKKSYYRKSSQKDLIYLQYTNQQGYTTVQIDQTIQSSIKLINNLFADMNQLRGMTIYIVQTVHRWRVQIQQWMDKCKCHQRVDFYLTQQRINNQDIKQQYSVRLYDVISNDTDFLWSSNLSQHIWLQFKNDPLMIRNVINVSQRKQKQILQKYFIEILYPNSDQIIDKIIKAVDMLNHVYKPKQINLYEEQQKLIENYLRLERKNNQEIGFDIDQKDDNARAIVILNNSRIKGEGSRVKKSHSQSKITVKKQFRAQIEHDNKEWNEAQFDSPYSNKITNKQNPRGWIFGKQLKKPATDRIRQIIKKHQNQMNYMKNHKNIIKPFNISNYSQKKSIALAYLSQKNNAPIKSKEGGWIFSQNEDNNNKKAQSKNKIFNHFSEGEDNKKSNGDNKQSPLQESRRKMYQSLVKMNPIIQQDPKQHQNDQQTPKNKNNKLQQKQKTVPQLKNRFFINKRQKTNNNKIQQQQLSKTINKNEKKQITNENKNTSGRKLVQSGIKINSIFNQQDKNILEQAQIEIQQEQTPLNFKQFFQVFRADTKDKQHTESRVVNNLAKSNLKKQQIKQLGGSLAVRKSIDKKRSQSLKSASLLPYFTQKKKNNLKKQLKKSTDKSPQKSTNSFTSYNKVSLDKTTQIQASNNQKIPPITIENKQHINLKTKQITKDIIVKYIRHICSQLPISSQSFTNYHTTAYQGKMITFLQDSTINSLIFDIEAEKDGKIGQAIVVETLSSTLKMRYTIQFINIYRFQLIANAVCKIAQELLSTSPCEEVVLKLVEDKVDPVSTHFIVLIDDALKKKAQKFSYFHILQKSILGLSHQNLYQRVYIFQGKTKNLIKQAISQKYKGDWRKRVAGSNYRSLVFETTSVALTSNFKLRSQNLNKAMVQIYKEESIGIMYVILLQKIMTKYHLKQLKIASLSLNDTDQTTGLVKKSPFLRSIFYGLLQIIKKSSDYQKGSSISNWVKSSITRFTNMTDLLNYLSYKQYDQIFKFDFLTQSRFILNHQLTLSQVNLSTSLDFVLQNTTNMLLINNHHNYMIQQIVRIVSNGNNQSIDDMGLSGYLLPTTQDNLKLFFISGKQYLSCADTLDLYSYIELIFKQSLIKQRYDIQQIAIPDLTKRKTKINSVKMFDGFLRLFPQRQFYSASTMRVQNLWQNFYPNAVISKPQSNAIIIQYPLIVGFYDCTLQMSVLSYILKQQK